MNDNNKYELPQKSPLGDLGVNINNYGKINQTKVFGKL